MDMFICYNEINTKNDNFFKYKREKYFQELFYNNNNLNLKKIRIDIKK